MTRETITLTKTEQQRGHVLTQILEGRLTVPEAAPLLHLSIRQVRRLLAEVRRHGLTALAHGNRGRVSPRRLAEAVRTRLVTLARTRYAHINDYHLTELLAEHEGLRLSRPTVQRALRAAGIGSPRTRRAPKHRRRRARMPQAGLLVLMDGSQHAWLEARGPAFVLQAALDDATGALIAAVFRPEEDAHGYFLVLRQLIRRYGIPAAVYTDRHGIFHREARTPQGLTAQLQGVVASTQIGRTLQELGIRWIPASSPQAKGRIERLFGTLQDRLVTELRLAAASTLAEAQRVLDRFRPRYNARFAQPAAQPEPAWRPPLAPADLERLCCFKYQRTISHDNTLQLGDRIVQLHPGPDRRSYAGARVDVHVHLDGRLTVSYHGQRLRATRLPQGQRPVWHFRKARRPLSSHPSSPDRGPSPTTHPLITRGDDKPMKTNAVDSSRPRG